MRWSWKIENASSRGSLPRSGVSLGRFSSAVEKQKRRASGKPTSPTAGKFADAKPKIDSFRSPDECTPSRPAKGFRRLRPGEAESDSSLDSYQGSPTAEVPLASDVSAEQRLRSSSPSAPERPGTAGPHAEAGELQLQSVESGTLSPGGRARSPGSPVRHRPGDDPRPGRRARSQDAGGSPDDTWGRIQMVLNSWEKPSEASQEATSTTAPTGRYDMANPKSSPSSPSSPSNVPAETPQLPGPFVGDSICEAAHGDQLPADTSGLPGSSQSAYMPSPRKAKGKNGQEAQFEGSNAESPEGTSDYFPRRAPGAPPRVGRRAPGVNSKESGRAISPASDAGASSSQEPPPRDYRAPADLLSFLTRVDAAPLGGHAPRGDSDRELPGTVGFEFQRRGQNADPKQPLRSPPVSKFPSDVGGAVRRTQSAQPGPRPDRNKWSPSPGNFSPTLQHGRDTLGAAAASRSPRSREPEPQDKQFRLRRARPGALPSECSSQSELDGELPASSSWHTVRRTQSAHAGRLHKHQVSEYDDPVLPQSVPPKNVQDPRNVGSPSDNGHFPVPDLMEDSQRPARNVQHRSSSSSSRDPPASHSHHSPPGMSDLQAAKQELSPAAQEEAKGGAGGVRDAIRMDDQSLDDRSHHESQTWDVSREGSVRRGRSEDGNDKADFRLRQAQEGSASTFNGQHAADGKRPQSSFHRSTYDDDADDFFKRHAHRGRSFPARTSDRQNEVAWDRIPAPDTTPQTCEGIATAAGEGAPSLSGGLDYGHTAGNAVEQIAEKGAPSPAGTSRRTVVADSMEPYPRDPSDYDNDSISFFQRHLKGKQGLALGHRLPSGGGHADHVSGTTNYPRRQQAEECKSSLACSPDAQGGADGNYTSVPRSPSDVPGVALSKSTAASSQPDFDNLPKDGNPNSIRTFHWKGAGADERFVDGKRGKGAFGGHTPAYVADKDGLVGVETSLPGLCAQDSTSFFPDMMDGNGNSSPSRSTVDQQIGKSSSNLLSPRHDSMTSALGKGADFRIEGVRAQESGFHNYDHSKYEYLKRRFGQAKVVGPSNEEISHRQGDDSSKYEYLKRSSGHAKGVGPTSEDIPHKLGDDSFRSTHDYLKRGSGMQRTNARDFSQTDEDCQMEPCPELQPRPSFPFLKRNQGSVKRASSGPAHLDLGIDSSHARKSHVATGSKNDIEFPNASKKDMEESGVSPPKWQAQEDPNIRRLRQQGQIQESFCKDASDANQSSSSPFANAMGSHTPKSTISQHTAGILSSYAARTRIEESPAQNHFQDGCAEPNPEPSPGSGDGFSGLPGNSSEYPSTIRMRATPGVLPSLPSLPSVCPYPSKPVGFQSNQNQHVGSSVAKQRESSPKDVNTAARHYDQEVHHENGPGFGQSGPYGGSQSLHARANQPTSQTSGTMSNQSMWSSMGADDGQVNVKGAGLRRPFKSAETTQTGPQSDGKVNSQSVPDEIAISSRSTTHYNTPQADPALQSSYSSAVGHHMYPSRTPLGNAGVAIHQSASQQSAKHRGRSPAPDDDPNVSKMVRKQQVYVGLNSNSAIARAHSTSTASHTEHGKIKGQAYDASLNDELRHARSVYAGRGAMDDRLPARNGSSLSASGQASGSPHPAQLGGRSPPCNDALPDSSPDESRGSFHGQTLSPTVANPPVLAPEPKPSPIDVLEHAAGPKSSHPVSTAVLTQIDGIPSLDGEEAGQHHGSRANRDNVPLPTRSGSTVFTPYASRRTFDEGPSDHKNLKRAPQTAQRNGAEACANDSSFQGVNVKKAPNLSASSRAAHKGQVQTPSTQQSFDPASMYESTLAVIHSYAARRAMEDGNLPQTLTQKKGPGQGRSKEAPTRDAQVAARPAVPPRAPSQASGDDAGLQNSASKTELTANPLSSYAARRASEDGDHRPTLTQKKGLGQGHSKGMLFQDAQTVAKPDIHSRPHYPKVPSQTGGDDAESLSSKPEPATKAASSYAARRAMDDGHHSQVFIQRKGLGHGHSKESPTQDAQTIAKSAVHSQPNPPQTPSQGDGDDTGPENASIKAEPKTKPSMSYSARRAADDDYWHPKPVQHRLHEAPSGRAPKMKANKPQTARTAADRGHQTSGQECLDGASDAARLAALQPYTARRNLDEEYKPAITKPPPDLGHHSGNDPGVNSTHRIKKFPNTSKSHATKRDVIGRHQSPESIVQGNAQQPEQRDDGGSLTRAAAETNSYAARRAFDDGLLPAKMSPKVQPKGYPKGYPKASPSKRHGKAGGDTMEHKASHQKEHGEEQALVANKAVTKSHVENSAHDELTVPHSSGSIQDLASNRLSGKGSYQTTAAVKAGQKHRAISPRVGIPTAEGDVRALKTRDEDAYIAHRAIDEGVTFGVDKDGAPLPHSSRSMPPTAAKSRQPLSSAASYTGPVHPRAPESYSSRRARDEGVEVLSITSHQSVPSLSYTAPREKHTPPEISPKASRKGQISDFGRTSHGMDVANSYAMRRASDEGRPITGSVVDERSKAGQHASHKSLGTAQIVSEEAVRTKHRTGATQAKANPTGAVVTPGLTSSYATRRAQDKGADLSHMGLTASATLEEQKNGQASGRKLRGRSSSPGARRGGTDAGSPVSSPAPPLSPQRAESVHINKRGTGGTFFGGTGFGETPVNVLPPTSGVATRTDKRATGGMLFGGTGFGETPWNALNALPPSIEASSARTDKRAIGGMLFGGAGFGQTPMNVLPPSNALTSARVDERAIGGMLFGGTGFGEIPMNTLPPCGDVRTEKRAIGGMMFGGTGFGQTPLNTLPPYSDAGTDKRAIGGTMFGGTGFGDETSLLNYFPPSNGKAVCNVSTRLCAAEGSVVALRSPSGQLEDQKQCLEQSVDAQIVSRGNAAGLPLHKLHKVPSCYHAVERIWGDSCAVQCDTVASLPRGRSTDVRAAELRSNLPLHAPVPHASLSAEGAMGQVVDHQRSSSAPP